MNENIIERKKTIILNTDMLLPPDQMNAIAQRLFDEIKSGLVIIPNGFTYEIVDRDALM